MVQAATKLEAAPNVTAMAVSALERMSTPAPPLATVRRPSTPSGMVVRATRRMDVQARFDMQFTTPLNAAHFALMDAMSVDAMASWMVRRKLRMMCRYEYHNNGFFMGVVDTYADYVIGTGPRLQMLLTENAAYGLTAKAARSLNKEIEARFEDWSEEVALGDKLHGTCAATCYNGEGFLGLTDNPNLDNPVKLDLADFEADQVTSPLFGMYPSEYPDQYFDGVVLDPWHRPRTYHILRQHPGAFGAFVILGYQFDAWPAANVLHDYRVIRQGQQRGIPQLLPALPNFANLRRYKLAVVLSAENAAKWGISVETNAPANAGLDQYGNPVAPADEGIVDTWEMEQAMFNLMPAGHRANMLHPEQPSQQHEELINAELAEIGRPLGMPLFVVSLDARQANMSSAYVAMQPMGKRVRVERKRYNRLLNRRIFTQFIREARLIPGLFSRELPDTLPHGWTWDRVSDHADPGKVANAAQTRIDSGVTSRRQEAADLSLDLDEQDEMSAADYGVSVEEYRAMLFQRASVARGNPVPAATAPGGRGQPPAAAAPEDEEID